MPLPYARIIFRLRRLRLSRTVAELYARARALTKDRYGAQALELLEKANVKLPELDDDAEEAEQEERARLEQERDEAWTEYQFFRDGVFGAEQLQPDDRVYAIARVALHGLGVSREFRLDGIAHDATEIALDWAETFDVFEGHQLDAQVALWVDRAASGPLRIGLLKMILPAASEATEGVSDPDPCVNDDGTMQLTVRATCRRLPQPPPLVVVRSTFSGGGNSNRIARRTIVFVELTSIDGLFRPTEPGWDGHEFRRSRALDGYTSLDQTGRIFTSRGPDGAWTPYSQHIVLHARVTVPGLGGSIGAVRDQLPRLQWRAVEDPDDWLRFEPTVHRDTLALVGGGLRGFADRGGQHRFAWQRAGEEQTVAGLDVETPLDWEVSDADAVGTSSVRLYCPHVAGDRFRVLAGVPPSDAYDVFGAATGAMTMWKRIFVDYSEMDEAEAPPIEKVPECFETSCIEMVMVRRGACPTREFLVDGEDASQVEPTALGYMNEHLGAPDPGRFQLVAARVGCRRAEAQEGDMLRVEGGRLVNDVRRMDAPEHQNAGVFSLAYFEAPQAQGDLSGRGFAAISLYLGAGNSFAGQILEAEHVGQRTRFWIEGHDLATSFDHCDGSSYAASLGTRNYFPGGFADAPMVQSGRHYDLSNVNPQGGGYPIVDANNVNAMLFAGGDGAVIPDGISPMPTVAERIWFGGRTMVFTLDAGYDRTETGQVVLMVHELTHAFGMPHKCGRYDLTTPRKGLCNMNYSGTRLLVGADLVEILPYARHDAQHCALHVRALRDVRLETNRALNWGGD